MRHIIENSNICKHAISELKLAGYTPNGNGPTNWMYHQVLEAVAVFASHGNSGHSAPWEIDFVKRLCNFDILTPLEKTYLTGYLNPAYHYATEPRKRK